jgi:hypothetical protein
MRRKVKRGVWRFTALIALISLGVSPATGDEPEPDTNVGGSEVADDRASQNASSDDGDPATSESADQAAKQETEKDDLDESNTEASNRRSWTKGWVPAFALTGSFQGHEYESSLSSKCDRGGPGGEGGALIGCSWAGRRTVVNQFNQPLVPGFHQPLPGLPNPLRDSADGSDFTVWPGVGIDLHLMSPTIFELHKIRPRLFINAEVTAQFPPTRRIANEAALNDSLTPPEGGGSPASYPTQAIEGGGSETLSEPKTFQFGAQIGFAFPVQIQDRKVRIKPSFGWINYQLDISGRVLSPLKDDVNGTSGGFSTWGPNLRTIDLSDSTTRSINGIGPGLEVELESGQFGPVAAAMFLGVNVYKILGDRTTDLDDQVSFADGTTGGDGLEADTYRAKWHHKVDPWMYRVKMGIRFHYMGHK